MEIGRITSRKNPLVRQAWALGSDGRLRRETGLFLCEGARLCRDAVRSGLVAEQCFFTPAAREKYGDYLGEILAICPVCYEIEEHVAALLSSTRSPQGLFCVCRRPSLSSAAAGPCLVLEELQDPGNLGTILRTAEALGLERIVLLGESCCDPWSPKALRAAMGAVFRLNPVEEADAEKLCKQLREEGFLLHASVPSDTALPVTGLDFSKGKHAVFVGNEGNGLRQATAALCDDRVTIPMGGRAESLNASGAAAILLWELTGRGLAG